jgi:hypothetical protein
MSGSADSPEASAEPLGAKALEPLTIRVAAWKPYGSLKFKLRCAGSAHAEAMPQLAVHPGGVAQLQCRK